MGTILPVGYGQAVIRLRCSGAPKDAVITMGYNPTTLSPAADAEAIFGCFASSGSDHGPFNAGEMCPTFTFLGVSVTEMDDTGPLLGEYNETIVGTNSGTTVPINTAMLVNKVTSAGGRKNRGRFFCPVTNIPEANVSPLGVIDNAFVTAQQVLWTNAYDALIDADLPPVILHSEAGTPTAITGFVVQAVCATQRRRMRS